MQEFLLEMGVPLKTEKILRRVYTSSRYKRRYGTASYNTADDTYKITISKNILNSIDKEIEQVIIHELLHTLDGCMNHGPKWKEWAKYVEDRSEYEIEVKRTAGKVNNESGYWLVQCPICGVSKKMYKCSSEAVFRCKKDNVAITPIYIGK